MDLVIYHRLYCPYSKRVREFIEKNGLRQNIEYFEIDEDADAIQKLVNLTGGQQVPCLVINGRPKLESEHIIKWLKSNLLDDKETSS